MKLWVVGVLLILSLNAGGISESAYLDSVVCDFIIAEGRIDGHCKITAKSGGVDLFSFTPPTGAIFLKGMEINKAISILRGEIMPNLLVHLTLGLVIAKILKVEKKSILLLGSFLPDIKVFFYPIIIITSGLSDANAFILSFSSPFGSLLLALSLASLFPRKEFLKVFGLLGVGIIGHGSIDILMFPLYGIEHYLLFYPVSWEPVGINANWFIEWMSLFSIIWVLLILLLQIQKSKKNS